ncbi:S8 family serine peptidase [Streptomyces sp. NPDC006475]|uniref:S8 family serine peptidase n=1 Tax=Streptomyces sp. NPDC006475 TaxID=3155719 RepID=UPI0033BC04F4
MVPFPRPGLIALGVVTALAVGGIPAATAVSAHPAGVASSAGAAQRSPGKDSTHTVTLITGDKVTIGTAADGTVIRSFEGAGLATTGYHRAVIDGATYVYPDSVLPYVSAGNLDKRLFNVTQLIADGFDDAHADRLPLIVNYTDAAATSRTLPKVAGSSVVRRLDSVQGASVAQNRDKATAFWSALTGNAASVSARSAKPAFANGIARVWLDGKVKADLSESTAQIGAQQVWEEGNTGKAVKVAVLDTGVDPEHPDLAEQIDAGVNFVPYEQDFLDYHGHGTHVASTIAGTGSASEGKERGVAPGARLRIGKVLDNEGRGQESWIIAGMEWAARDQQAKIINMSLGGAGDHTDPMSAAVDRLSRETGALFVVASGNGGPRTISSPGAADSALTVGAVDSADRLAEFSSQGPRDGDAGVKPEITAPGVDILAARTHYKRGGSGHYTTMTGTSMATPHVAGAAALLAAAHPDWTGARLKEALVSSAKATPSYTPYEAGAGRLDAAAAVHATVFATVSAHSGFHTWPPKPGETDVRKVTYTNVGDAPVALDLAVDAGTTPAGMYRLSDSRVTVPAHGITTVSVTADLERLPADQPVSGMVTATDSAGMVRARTLIGGAREGLRRTLTVVAKDRAGKPLTGRVHVISERLVTTMDVANGTGTMRLPEGSYSGWIHADVQGANGPHSLGMAVLGFNDVQLDQDRTVTLDGRKARQILARAPKQTTAVAPRLDVERSFARTLFASSMLPNPSYDSIWALPTGKKVTEGRFEFGARFRIEQPALTVGTGAQTYADPLVKRAAKPLPAGTRNLKAVFAGEGSAGQLARHDVRGLAVVVRRSDTVAIREQAEAAAAAGASLLLVVNDGIGRLQPWDEHAYSPESPAPLTVATLDTDQGADLINRLRRGGAVLKVASHPTTEYLYDVVHHWSGAVPTEPTWRVQSGGLARADVSFRNHRPGKANEFRYDTWQGWTAGNQLIAPAQGERTDWVTADADWVEAANIAGETGQRSIDLLRYAPGKTGKVSWFGPIQRPRMAPGTFQPVRYLDTMYVPAPGWGDSGAGHVGDAYANFGVANRVSLHQGDRELTWSNAERLTSPQLAAERLPYRLVVDNNRGAWEHPYSTRTLTEWNFTSAATGSESTASLPLIQLDYGVDTDEAGRADRHARLTVTASHLPGTTAAISKPVVEVSYDDGATWHRSDLGRDGDGWRTSLKAPTKAGFVSLRVTGRDSADNTVSQTITRAFGLR